MATSTCCSGESVSQKAITGMFTYAASLIAWWSVRGSVTTSMRGCLNASCFWFVNCPGLKRPAMEKAPVFCANFSTALWPYPRADHHDVLRVVDGHQDARR